MKCSDNDFFDVMNFCRDSVSLSAIWNNSVSVAVESLLQGSKKCVQHVKMILWAAGFSCKSDFNKTFNNGSKNWNDE